MLVLEVMIERESLRACTVVSLLPPPLHLYVYETYVRVCMCVCARLCAYEGLLGRVFLLILLQSSRIEKNARSTAITTALSYQKRAALTL